MLVFPPASFNLTAKCCFRELRTNITQLARGQRWQVPLGYDISKNVLVSTNDLTAAIWTLSYFTQ